jgi:hypothetical protein
LLTAQQHRTEATGNRSKHSIANKQAQDSRVVVAADGVRDLVEPAEEHEAGQIDCLKADGMKTERAAKGEKGQQHQAANSIV